jgi:hypothetical protein
MMDAKKFQELSERVKQVLEEAGIEAEGIQISANVKNDFYDSIKDNFPECPHPNVIVYAGKKGVWHVGFIRNTRGLPRMSQ